MGAGARDRPGTFERWGIGYRQLKEINPRLVYCWLGGFGGWGPGRVRASYDILGQSQGGNFGMTGKQEFLGGAPSKHTIWLADYWGGMMGAVQILAALYYRDKISGEGTFTEYSQVHGVTRQLEYALPLYGRHGITRERWGNWDTQLCVHGIIKCGKSSYPKSENSQEVANHPHWLERGAVQWLDDPTYGDLLHQGPAYKMSETPPRLKWALKPVGADNELILGKLAGLSSEDLRRLEEQECI